MAILGYRITNKKPEPARMHVAFRRSKLLASKAFLHRFPSCHHQLRESETQQDGGEDVAVYMPIFFDPSDACHRAVNWFWGLWRTESFAVMNQLWVLPCPGDTRGGARAAPIPLDFVEIFMARIRALGTEVMDHVKEVLLKRRIQWLLEMRPRNEIVQFPKKPLIKELYDVSNHIPRSLVYCGYSAVPIDFIDRIYDAIIDWHKEARCIGTGGSDHSAVAEQESQGRPIESIIISAPPCETSSGAARKGDAIEPFETRPNAMRGQSSRQVVRDDAIDAFDRAMLHREKRQYEAMSRQLKAEKDIREEIATKRRRIVVDQHALDLRKLDLETEEAMRLLEGKARLHIEAASKLFFV